MLKKVLPILGALLIAASTVQIAKAAQRHVRKAALTIPWDCHMRFGHPLLQSNTGLITVFPMHSRPQLVVTNLTYSR
jgi:hypothetical protein